MSIALPTSAYLLPAYAISKRDRARAAELVLAEYEAGLSSLSQSIRISRLEDHRRSPKLKLTANERKAARSYEDLRAAIGFWSQVADLKRTLLDLPGVEKNDESRDEADAIAKTIVGTIYGLSQEYGVSTSAWIHNFLVSRGWKKKGYCYHYVEDLMAALSGRGWRRYEFRWGEAYAGTFRENNALIITAKEGAFDEGLAVDAWRSAGRPFWTSVADDRFPWMENSR